MAHHDGLPYEPSEPLKRAELVTVYVSIGNSDDKLSQREWATFCEQTWKAIYQTSNDIYGEWYSQPNSPYQNACFAFSVLAASRSMLKGMLDDLRVKFRQDSIVWAEAQTTFIGPSTTTAASAAATRWKSRGDGPCDDCGTENNIIWSTDNTVWNEVIRPGGEVQADPFLCVPCFVVRVDKAGLAPTGWRVIPEWHWETHAERAARRGPVYFPESDATDG